MLSSSSLLLADYQWPLKERTYLTGTFGEFRRSHIHAGIDISTGGRTGLAVYASADGLLQRVKTQHVGFGKTVYLQLPDGKFLVYAHLEKFSPKIKNIIQRAQDKENKYLVDIYPEEEIKIRQGQLIGYSGDSGGVNPHLHLELRDEQEQPLNILNYDFPSPKLPPPTITALAVCDPLNTFVRKKYRIINNTIKGPITISGSQALALAAYTNSHGNKVGIYRIDCFIDGKLFFWLKMDIFNYDNFNDVFLVYNKDSYLTTKRAYYNLFRAFSNELPFYPLAKDGILKLAPGKHKLTINVYNHQGKPTTLNTTIIAQPALPATQPALSTGPWHSQDGRLKLKIAPENLYCPLAVKITTLSRKKRQPELRALSKIYQINPEAAVFKKAAISIKASPNKKMGIYRRQGKKWKYLGSGNRDTSRKFGDFCLFEDKIPPKIEIITTTPVFRAKITDLGSGLDYESISLLIDKQPVIAEYDINSKELRFKIIGTISKGKHQAVCIARDRIGNEKRLSITIPIMAVPR